MWPLALVLPVLCVFSLVARLLTRAREPRVRLAWMEFLSTLLAVSGLLTFVAGVLALAISPSQPSVLSQGLSDLDNRASYPSLPVGHPLSAAEIATGFKPLVTVITPAQRRWFSKTESPSNAFGAGVVLQSNQDGYLIATARHVIDGESEKSKAQRALIASVSGTWTPADVVARHKDLDLLLLWLPRAAGRGSFTMPVAARSQVGDGSAIFVIGHPQGLRYTLSTGIVSRKDGDILQITAPISPGNSGGPLLDEYGRLAGIVTSKMDRNINPNEESLNFAVCADALLDSSQWTFYGEGRKYLTAFEHGQPVIAAGKTEKENPNGND